MDEIGGDEFFVGHTEDAFEIGLAGFLQRGVNLFDARVLRGADGQVNDGDISGRHAERHAGEFALGDGENFADGFRCASGGWNDVDAGRTATAPILLGRTVNGFLRRGHRVNGGHQTGFDAEAVFDENVHERREAVRGAGGVGNKDQKSTRLNSSHHAISRMPSSA